MAKGKIKQLIDRYEMLLEEKDYLKKQTKDVNAALDEATIDLATAISDEDLTDINDGDYTYTPGVQTRYSFKSQAALDEAGLDKFEPFEQDEALQHLVKKNINNNSLQSAMKEMAESEDGIPEDVMAVLNTFDKISISRRQRDASTKSKVADALKKRRDDNV